MAKKPAAKSAEPKAAPTPAQPPTRQAAPATQDPVNFVTMRHWATGTVTQTGSPVLIIETADGTRVGIHMTIPQAKDVSKAIGDLVNKPAKQKQTN